MQSPDREMCYCAGPAHSTLPRSSPQPLHCHHRHPSRPDELNLLTKTTTHATPRTGNGDRSETVNISGTDKNRSSVNVQQLSIATNNANTLSTSSLLGVDHRQEMVATSVSVGLGGSGAPASLSSQAAGIGFPCRTSSVGGVDVCNARMAPTNEIPCRSVTPGMTSSLSGQVVELHVVGRTPRQFENNSTTRCNRCPSDSGGVVTCRCPDVASTINDNSVIQCDPCRHQRNDSTSITLDECGPTDLLHHSEPSCSAVCTGNNIFFEGDCSRAMPGIPADVIEPGLYTNNRFTTSGGGNLVCRLMVSFLVGQLVGVILFAWMFCHLDYGLTASVVAGSMSAVFVCLVSAASRACRAVGILALPSLATGQGRLAFVVVAVGALLSGPVSNVYVNMEEVSRAMGCSAEQSYNQTMFLLQPLDAMMMQLNWTIGGLQDAATNIGRGLKPLEDGLGTVEMYLDNGKLQLYGTRKV